MTTVPGPVRASGHEQSDIEPKYAVLSTAGLVVLLGFVFAASLSVFHYFTSGVPAASFGNPESGIEHLPEPRLQISPHEDLEKLRDANRNILETYDWVSREDNTVRIPIERAMDIIAEQGLPTFAKRVSK